MMKLNLGCGSKKLEGYINADIEPSVNPDMIIDLDKFPYPFKDSSIDEVYMEHSLEHVKYLKETLKEIYRILKPDGILKLMIPHFSRGLTHPFHNYHFGYGFLNNIREEVPEFKFEQVTKIRFHYSRMPHPFVILLNYPLDFLANLHLGFCERCWCYLVGGFEEMKVELKVIK